MKTTINPSKENKKSKTTISLFEGSYQFFREETELRVSEGYIQFKLAKQYEYRPTEKDLWAEVRYPDGSWIRYELNYHKNLLVEIGGFIKTKA